MKFKNLFIISILIGSIVAQIDPTCQTYRLTSAQLDKYGPTTGGNAITFDDKNIPGGYTNFNFAGSGGKMENQGNTLRITGQLIPADGSSVPVLNANMVFNKISSGTPKKELIPSAYVPQGPIDTNTWQYYALDSSVSQFTVSGGNADGMVVLLSPYHDMPLQVGIGANGKNVNNGASGWFSFKFMKNGQLVYSSDKVVDINVDLICDSEVLNESGDYDPTAAQGFMGGQAIFISAHDLSPFGGNNRFDFINSCAKFSFFSNGDLFFFGQLSPLNKSDPMMSCYIHWTKNTNTHNMPKLELPQSSYVPIGTIDPSTWKYYDVDTGASACKLNGTTIKIVGQKMMPMQVGRGANGKNDHFGASVWLDYAVIYANGTIVSNETDIFDINVDLTPSQRPTPTVTPTTTPTQTITPTPSQTQSTTPTPSSATTTGTQTNLKISSIIGSTSSSPINTGSSTSSITGSAHSTSDGNQCTWICVPNGAMSTTTGIQTTAAGGTFPPRTNGTTAAGGSNDAGNTQVSKFIVAFFTVLALTFLN